jgi:hypothetical protein
MVIDTYRAAVNWLCGGGNDSLKMKPYARFHFVVCEVDDDLLALADSDVARVLPI